MILIGLWLVLHEEMKSLGYKQVGADFQFLRKPMKSMLARTEKKLATIELPQFNMKKHFMKKT